MKAIINGKIVLENSIINNKILIFNNRIVDIIDDEGQDLSKMDIIDAKGHFIAPGLIDLHTHGAGGYEFGDETENYIDFITKKFAECGVTGFLATLPAMSQENLIKTLDDIREYMNENKAGGAKILGVHLEGPLLNPIRKGAMMEENLYVLDKNIIDKYKDIIKIITYAPEMDKDNEFLKYIKLNTEIVLSIGHSNATYDEAINAIDLGVEHCTHLFNAMTPLSHRDLGVVGAALESNITTEIIADGIHVKPELFNMLLKNKEKSKIVLVTDSIRPAGLEDGEYNLGGQKVFKVNQEVRMENGVLAGSVLTLNKAVKNFVENTNLRINEGTCLASINPTRVINANKNKGSIRIGKDSDMIIMNDNFDVYMTIVKGDIVFVDKEIE